MKHDDSHGHTVVESFLAAKPKHKRLGYITSANKEMTAFTVMFPVIDYECIVFRDEFEIVK